MLIVRLENEVLIEYGGKTGNRTSGMKTGSYIVETIKSIIV
jgi:hypothetical protein